MSVERKKQKKMPTTNPAATRLSETVVSKPSRPVITRRRKWLFRLSAMIIPLVLFFAVLEFGLRLGGYGYPTTFFVGPDANGIYTSNYRFGWRFFPRALAREPHTCFISAKPAGAVRIFVLGSSAAMGASHPSFSFGRILEVMLRERYPGTRFEVVNAAMTAINSHVALEIARDCAAHQPDLFIVYMGNNEVVGPYGPGTVFQQWSPRLRFIRASIWVKSTRIGQLIGDVVSYLGSQKGTPAQWQGMEMFLKNQVAADDPRLEAVYKNYRQNLIDICDVARRAGAGVILSTVATNLRDCPPLASLHRPDLDAKSLAQWESIYKSGVELETNSRWPEAIAQFEEAARIDDRFADLQFRLGRCLAAAGRFPEAYDRFISARDLDVLRFRADSHINAVICEVAAEQEAAGVRLVDAEQALAKSDLAPNGILGGDLFYEHVHLTFDGNYLLARAVLDQVCEALPKAVRSGKTGPVPSRQRCAEALVLTSWDEYQMANAMVPLISQPPFTNQMDHAINQAAAMERTESLRKLAFTPQALQAAWRAYEAALRESPDNLDLHLHIANLASQSGRLDVAIEHLQIVVEKQPWWSLMHKNLGDTLKQCERREEAIKHYQQALRLNPDFVEAHNNLGDALVQVGRIQEAIEQFKQALELKPDYMEAHNNIGIALARLGQNDEAIAHLQKALELEPNNVGAHYTLGILLARRGQTDEAIAHLQKALEIKPDYAEAHNKLGEVLVGVGRAQEAISHFERALQLMPDNAKIKKNLNNSLERVNDSVFTISRYEEAIKRNPNSAEAHNNLAWLLATQDAGHGGNPAKAISLAERACELTGNKSSPYLDTLAAAYAAAGRFTDAISTAQKAIQLAADSGQTQLAEQIKGRLELYRAGRAYEEPANRSKL